MEALKSELLQGKTGLEPQDIGATAAESARLDLSKVNRVTVTVALGAGTGTTCTLTLRQHTAASGGTSADVVSTVPFYYAADVDTAMTKVEATGVAAMTIADLDTAAGLVEVPVYLDDLDEGYRWVSLSLAASGSARIVSMVYHVDTKNKAAYEVEL